MALSTPSVLNTVNHTLAANSLASGSVSPTTGGLILATYTGRRSGVVPTFSISDTLSGTQTWTQYADTGGSTPQINVSTFIAQAGTPGSGTVTISFSSQCTDGIIQISQTTGQNQTSAVRNAAQAHTDTATSLSCTLTFALLSTSMGIAMIGDGSNTAPASMAASGFTALYRANNGSNLMSLGVFYDLTSPATTCTITGLDGTASGMVYIEIQAALVPTVTTSAATSVLSTSATGNGNVTADNGSPITERGFVWSLNANPTTSDSKVTAAGTTGSYTGSMTGLSQANLYHYRAYAINAQGTSYGADTTFTTGYTAGFFRLMQ